MLNEVKSSFGGNKKYMTVGALAIATIIGAVGGSSLNAIQTKAQDTGTITTQTEKSPDAQFDPVKGGHVGSNGVKEELLTGDTAEKVKAAALIAVPGGTIQRVETDAEGSSYEAHITKADDTRVTVKLDSNFSVTSTETGYR